MGDLSSKVGDYGHFVYLRNYSRWQHDKKKRETWDDTVDRYMDFMRENLGNKLSKREYGELRDAIYELHVMPSMRLLWSAGEATRKNNMAAYNCSYSPIDKLERFAEGLFILTSGAGFGFSCEREVVDNLPVVQTYTPRIKYSYSIDDSREGWSDALLYGMKMWYSGQDVIFDYSRIRPEGSPLITFGGRSSGPLPLMELLEFTKKTIIDAQGRKLTSLEVHDIMCQVGQIVVAGGTRRSSLLSLSDLDDYEMMGAKSGDFPIRRHMANNSAVYNQKPSYGSFHREWTHLVESGTGERGIFNREGLRNSAPDRRKPLLGKYLGCNPCAEILLNRYETCNLSNIVAYNHDGISELMLKAKYATILGTYQATLTDFTYLSPEWKQICDTERLLGVSLSGVYDNPLLLDPYVLRTLKDHIVRTNVEYSERFGISPSTATTCVKPSGNSSQMLNCGSGIHPRYSRYHIRRIRISSSDPLFHMIKEQGVPYYPENGQPKDKAHTLVLEFPVKTPDNSILRSDITALDHLEHWKTMKLNYTEHTASMTCYVAEDEWDAVRDWVWSNWDHVGGLSFLPKEDANIKYKLAPYEEIDEAEYRKREASLNLDFSKLPEYELDDRTEGAREYACVGDKCELT
jgi:ribonucleoside-triphosphate reductase (thioredoxin)